MLDLDGCRPSGARSRPAPELITHDEGDLGTKQLDGAHHLLVGHRTDADLRHKAPVAEELVLEEDILHDLLRAADHERAARRAYTVC